MSGIARASTSAPIILDYPDVSPGFTQGRIPWVPWVPDGSPAVVITPFGVENSGVMSRTAAGGAAISKSEVARGSVGPDTTAPELDWYGKVHLLPRETVAFGNIITAQTDQYELYSAFRGTDTTESLIVNNALPGISLPENTPPIVVPPGTSMLDSSSTDNSGGTGLGTLVQLDVVADTNGLPVFNTTVDFTFTLGGTLKLGVSGTRIVLISAEPEAPISETLEFFTNIIPAGDGKEQRISPRKNPRQSFRYKYRLEGTERQRFQATMFDWMANLFAIPWWPEQLRLTATTAPGATQFQVNTTAEVDLRVGGLAVLYRDFSVFDVITISAIGATTVDSVSPAVFGYTPTSRDRLIPVRTCWLRGDIAGVRHLVDLEDFDAEFLVSDNDTGIPTPDTSPFSTYLGKVLLDDCNFTSGTSGFRLARKTRVIDNRTGVVSQTSPWDKQKRNSNKGFVASNRAQILELRRLLFALRGRQVSFWIPTFLDNMEAKLGLTLGQSTLDITNIGYARFVVSREPKATFKITFTDDTSLVRVVQSAVEVDSTTERLTLDTTWPATRPLSEIKRIEFYEQARFDTDRFTINYPRIGLARLTAPVKVVFD